VQVASPGPEGLAALRAILAERTGERYLRDLVRLLVESVDDIRYGDMEARIKLRGSRPRATPTS
jgi:hypothetical protein